MQKNEEKSEFNKGTNKINVKVVRQVRLYSFKDCKCNIKSENYLGFNLEEKICLIFSC